MRPMLVLALLPLLCSTLHAQPRILWRFDTRDASFGQSAMGDIDGDGRLEVVFGCYRNDSCIYALNAEDGTLLWKFNASSPGFEGCNDVAPLIADANGDGTLEVIVASSCNPKTYCFDGRSGAILWEARTRGSDSPPSMGDVDGDGKPEILHGEFGGWVRCLNAEDGSLAWDLAVDTHSWIQTAPTLLDADGDGALDFVVATWNRTAGDTNTVRAYRCRDRKELWRVPLADVVYHGTAVADLDMDGKPELVIGDYSGTVTVINAEDGSILYSLNRPGYYHGAPVTIGDLDGNGTCELVTIRWYEVTAFNASGSALWTHDIRNFAGSFRGAALSDVDGDRLPDVVFGTSDGRLVALRGTTGAPVYDVDLAADYGDTRYTLDHAPVIADVDGDGAMDAIIVGGHADYPDFSKNFGRAYAVRLGEGFGPPWLMFQHDVSRSSSMNAGGITSIHAGDPSAAPALHIFPNPTRGKLNIITEGIREGSTASVTIRDAAGRVIIRQLLSGDHSTVDLHGRPPGVYLATLHDGRGIHHTRFILTPASNFGER